MYCTHKNYSKAIQKIRIDVGTLVGCETDEEAYIIFREMNTEQMMQLKSLQGCEDNMFLDFMKEKMPSIIVDHNFYEDEEGKKKLTNEQVTNLIWEKIDLTAKVVEVYSQKAFRLSKPRTESTGTVVSN